MVWLQKVMVLRLRSWRGGKEMRIHYVQYKEITEPLVPVEENTGGIFVRWSTADRVVRAFCGKEVEQSVVRVGERYGIGSLSPMMGSSHLGKVILAWHAFNSELLWSQDQFCVSRL